MNVKMYDDQTIEFHILTKQQHLSGLTKSPYFEQYKFRDILGASIDEKFPELLTIALYSKFHESFNQKFSKTDKKKLKNRTRTL
jgi:hypothetical protein